MFRPVLSVLAVTFLACGPQSQPDPGNGNPPATGFDFTGTYSGTLLESTTCSDGSGASQNQSADYTLSDSGSVVTVTFAGQCSPLIFNGDGDVLSLSGMKDCGLVTSGTVTFDGQVTAGTIESVGDGIEYNEKVTLTSATVSCTSTFNGDLPKQ